MKMSTAINTVSYVYFEEFLEFVGIGNCVFNLEDL